MMKIKTFALGISIILSLASFSAFPSWEENESPETPVSSFQAQAPVFEDVIIELDTPPILDFKFPKIEGFKTISTILRARLARAKINKNVLALLNHFLDSAESAWEKPPESKLRTLRFRRNLELFKLALNWSARFRLIKRSEAQFLLQKAEQALWEYEVETAVLEVRKILADSHQQLLQDLKELLWQNGFPSEQDSLKLKAEFFSVFNGIATSVPQELLDQIRQLPNVKNVELEQKFQVQSEEFIPPQIDLIGAPYFWEQGITGKGFTVAILDTGIDLNHIDLKNNLWINQAEINISACQGVPLDYDQDGIITIPDLNYIYQLQLQDPSQYNTCVNDFDQDGEITGLDLIYRESSNICAGTTGTPSAVNPLINCRDEDGNKKIDDLIGWNFYSTKINPDDDHYHGTHCAGIIAGNGLYLGVAPEALILPVKVINENGVGYGGGIISGIDYVINAPYQPLAQVISMSLGSSVTGSADGSLALAVDKAVDAGVIVAVAAGNNGGSSFTISEPGTSRKAITVGGSVAQDRYSPDMVLSISSRGPLFPTLEIKPDLIAPSAQICSARNNNARPELLSCQDPWHIALWGTSMATPHVAGAAVLIKQKYPEFGPQEVKSLLMQTAFDLNLPFHYQGAGRLDLEQASQAQVLVSPQKLEFGIDPQTSNFWQSQPITVTLFNLSASAHNYELAPAPQAPPGISFNITPNFPVRCEPGDTVQFQISLAIDNSRAPNADFPGYLHHPIYVFTDQNYSSPAAHLDSFVIKTCLVTAGCQDCASGLKVDIYNEEKLFFRFPAKKSLTLPFYCNTPFSVFVNNWSPTIGENTYFFIKDNLVANPNANALFKKSDAPYKYYINPVDQNGGSFAWNTAYMSLSGRVGLKKRFFPASAESNPGLVFKVSSSASLASRYLTIYFTRLSDKYEFSWDLYVHKAGRYYQFSDYQGDGIFTNITYQNNPQDLRHPRIGFPPLPDGESYKLSYGNNKYITIAGNTTTSDLLYFIPPKNPNNESIRLPSISFVNPAGVINNFLMPGIRAHRKDSSLNIFRTVSEDAKTYPLNYLSPSILMTRDEIKLLKPPLIWYGAVAPYLSGNKMIIAFTHKNFKYEKNKGVNSIIAPLFAFQTGEAESITLKGTLIDAQGITRKISIDNLTDYNSSNNTVLGLAQIELEYPKYYFNGIPGTAKVQLIIDPHNNDLTPPFIDNFNLTADQEITDTFYSNTTNIINLKVSDTFPEENEKPAPNIKLYYRIFGSNDNWKELTPLRTDQFIFQPKYKDSVYLSLRIIAWDKIDDYETPNGNIMDYIIEPAFFYNANPVCYNFPPLPGGFYFGDVNGDGIIRINPELDYCEAILKRAKVKSDCPFPIDVLALDMDGNGFIENVDPALLESCIFDEDHNNSNWIDGQVYFMDLYKIPSLNRSNKMSGKLSVLVSSYSGNERPGFGVEYKLISNPYNCVSLYGRNPHPDWTGPQAQYIKVNQEGKSVFEISDETGIAEIEVQVNPTCLAGSQVLISACVPADREIIEYCNCADPSTWFICYCRSGKVPEGCDCEDSGTWSRCGSSEQEPPSNCFFDSPYQYHNKQSQRICAEPIVLTIE